MTKLIHSRIYTSFWMRFALSMFFVNMMTFNTYNILYAQEAGCDEKIVRKEAKKRCHLKKKQGFTPDPDLGSPVHQYTKLICMEREKISDGKPAYILESIEA